MLAHVYAASISGIDAGLVKVEVDVHSSGLPKWDMVGMLETAVKESKERVSSAIRNAGFGLPSRRTTVSLSPADIKKSGAHYDLPIALALLIAAQACRPAKGVKYVVAGELSLEGKVLPVSGVLLMAIMAGREKQEGVIVPAANAWEAKMAATGEVIAIECIAEAVDFLNTGNAPDIPSAGAAVGHKAHHLDLGEVRGQPFARRGLEIAAAGAHNIALRGPPGTGKTMLAERLPSILPPLSREEAIDVAKILSCHGFLKNASDFPRERPFRAPHHSASYAGLVGGLSGGALKLGEISLAHNGVLFLDELGEFRKDALEVLRQPIESGEIRLARAGRSATYPAQFQLAAAFNPCRCGFFGHHARPCTCSVAELRRYRTKLSGPLLDRIDLHIEVSPPPHEALIDSSSEEGSEAVRERVIAARERQTKRHGSEKIFNAGLKGREIGKYCPLGLSERRFLKAASANLSLSARSVHRVIKVARTIADLGGDADIKTHHLAEALQFRPQTDEL